LKLASDLKAKLAANAPVKGTAQELAEQFGMSENAVEIGNLLDKAALNCCCVERELVSGTWVYSVK
jgi:glucose-6-phosphate isomerase